MVFCHFFITTFLESFRNPHVPNIFNAEFDIIDYVTTCYHPLSVMIQTIEAQIQKHPQCSSNTHSPS
jgi:hypothetical protein